MVFGVSDTCLAQDVVDIRVLVLKMLVLCLHACSVARKTRPLFFLPLFEACRVSGVVFRVWVSGMVIHMGLACRASGLGFGVEGLGFGLWGSEFRVLGLPGPQA